MRLAFLHFWTLRLPRGVETLTLSLANALAEQGSEVHLLCARRTREPLVNPLPRVKVHEFPTFRFFEAKTIVPFYAATLARERFDVVISFFADFGEAPALALADRIHRSRLFLYLTFPPEAAPHRYAAYKRAGWEHRADCLLADAEYTATAGKKYLGRQVVVLPGGTDPRRFRPDPRRRAAMRAQLGFAPDDVVLLNVAALEPRKGVWRVLEAMPAVRAECPGVRFLVLGEGPARASLEARAAELGVREAVVFAGTTNDLPPYYQAADIFVMLPDAEAGSIALLEAMASELPVVVSEAGGLGEVVGKRQGLRVDARDATAIRSALVRLARDPRSREAMGRAGRQLVQQEYAWEALATRLLGIIADGHGYVP